MAAIEDWYESQQGGLGAEFRKAVDVAIVRIGDNPLSYPERYRANRRMMLRRFPYVVWHRVHEGTAIVLAFVTEGVLPGWFGSAFVPAFEPPAAPDATALALLSWMDFIAARGKRV